MGGQVQNLCLWDSSLNRTPARMTYDLESEIPRSSEMFCSRVSLGLNASSERIKKRWPFGYNSYRAMDKALGHEVSKEFYKNSKSCKLTMLDPNSRFIQNWNIFVFMTCLGSVFIDPLFIYLPFMNVKLGCLDVDKRIRILVTIPRMVADMIYLLHIILQFRTAFVAPSSKVLGRGELVMDSVQIAKRYLKRLFLLDVVVLLPIPQLVAWNIFPMSTYSDNTKSVEFFIILMLYVPRLYRIFLFAKQIVKTAGVLIETPWAGAVYNLFLYMLASHMAGAFWYWLAVGRQDSCFRENCISEIDCKFEYLYCGRTSKQVNFPRTEWLSSTQVFNSCSPDSSRFNFGIYIDALTNGITSSTSFNVKYLYCFWWGLRNLSTFGQGLLTGPFVGEMLFSISLAIIALILFALLIGNMQAYLQSLSARLEQMRLKRQDIELWMSHRRLPPDLRDRVRRHEQYKWVATRGVDEQSILQDLPSDLSREIKRHLCLDLVRKVPLFNQMDDRLLDAMCERLKPALHSKGAYVIRECDPVNEMLFIIRGQLQSVTTNGGRSDFFNAGYLGPGDFCGDELLTWALHPKPCVNLPLSTRTVIALCEVEAFALGAEELKMIAAQFKRLHSQQLQHTFRAYSQQWRTWAALYIQTAWRRFKRRKLAKLQIRDMENSSSSKKVISNMYGDNELGGGRSQGSMSLGAALFASRFVSNAMRGIQRMQSRISPESSCCVTTMIHNPLAKPEDPALLLHEGE